MLKATMNRYKNVISLILLAAGIIIFMPSCVKQPRQKPTLPFLTMQSADYQVTQRGITLRAKILTTQESKELFNDYTPYAKKLPRKPQSRQLKTVLLSLENKSGKPISVNREDIRLPLVNYKHIYFSPSTQQTLKIGGGTITAGVVPFLGISVAAFLSATPGCCPCWLLVPLTLGSGCGLLSSGAFLTGSILWQNNAKKQLHKDFKQVALTDTVTIAPQQRKELLCFVRQQKFNNNFAVTITDDATQIPMITFAVTIPRI